MSFGVVSSTITAGYKSNNLRRKIYWQFPQGAAQLTGILSLLPNSEETDKPEFGWFERRFPTQRTTTITTGTATSATFLDSAGTAITDSGSGITLTAGTTYRMTVASTGDMKPTHVLEIRDAINASGTVLGNITGVVIAVINATTISFRPNATFTVVRNLTASTPNNIGISVAIIGTANRENSRSGTGIVVFPIAPTNYTQIFRSAFNISRTALKAGMNFDSSGTYNTMAKENGIRHMLEMEKAFLFGQKTVTNVADPETGDVTPETQTGGVIWYLQQYEAVNSIYRGGAGAAAVTTNTDSDKRILDMSGAITRAQWDSYLARLFTVTQDVGYEKLCLCGAGFLQTINKFYDATRVVQSSLEEKSTGVKFTIYTIETLFGTVHFKTHPLFTMDPYLTNNGLFLDLGNLRFRPLTDSDTKFLKGRQETDRDGRKDEWITEAGLELKFPESCMYIKNAAAVA